MKQILQIPYLKCESHPGASISSVSIEQKCPHKSRLSCMKCLKDYKQMDMDNFIDISDLISTESLITSFQNIKGFNNPIVNYLSESEQQYRKIIDGIIQQLHNKVDALKVIMIQQIVPQKEYLMKTAELKIQYDAELTNLQNKIQSVSQLNDYHNTKQWVELKECLDSYISLFYQPENQEINVTLVGLNSQIPKRFDPQSIQQCKDCIGTELDKLCKQLPFIRLTQTILDNSIIGNQIIDRITDKGKKSMKLIFKGQRDGMNATSFWQLCANKGPTIVICESKSGQIFGGYTPCKWINNNSWQMDESMTSFLFSVTKQQIYPLKNKVNTIYGNIIYGPLFGAGHDLNIAADFQSGSSNLSNIFYDTSQYQISDPKTHLMGGLTPALKSIEIYLIE